MIGSFDYIVIILYLLILAGVGVFFGFFVKDIQAYFKGNGVIPWGMSALSNFMSSLSTFVFIAYAGIAYADGIVAVTVIWCTVPPFLFAAFVMGKRWLRSRIITPIEYLETRFSSQIRQLFSWGGLFMRFLDNMVRQYAMGVFLETALGIPFIHAVLISGVITTIFTLAGGVWSVVMLDALQFIVLLVVACLLVPLSLEAAGGLTTLMNNHPEHFEWFGGPKGELSWLLVYYLMVLIKYNGNWVFIQRFYSVKNEKAVKKLGLLSALLLLFIPIIYLLPAIAAREILPNLSDPEQSYVALAVELLPSGLLGLMIAAMFSATMSSLNSEFNVMSAVLTNDFYKRILNPKASSRSMINVARLNVLLVGIIVVVGSLYIDHFGGAFEANKVLTGLFAIPFAIPLILGLLNKKTNSLGAFLSVMTGIGSGLFFNAVPEIPWNEATLIQITSCISVFLISGWIFPVRRKFRNEVDRFFLKINTSINEDEEQLVSPGFMKILTDLFTMAMILSGILFSAIGFPHYGKLSGNVTLILGMVCILSAIFLKRYLTGTFKYFNKEIK